MGDKVKEEDKKDIEEKVKALRDVVNGDDKGVIESKTSELSEALQKIGEQMYQNSENQAQPEDSAGSENQKQAENAEDQKTEKSDAEEGEVVS